MIKLDVSLWKVDIWSLDMVKTGTIKSEGQTTANWPDVSTTYNYISGVWKIDDSQLKTI